MAQLEHIEAIEERLWSSADNLRANSNFASNEYFMPVMGLIFLRHAYSRFLAVKAAIEPTLPTRGGVTRPLTKEDFSQKGAIFLQEKAQYDYLVSLPDSADRAKALIDAMDSIESDYENLRGMLPKGEYQELTNDVLGELLRRLNPEELKRVSGDVFGRIYEYFLTQFAGQKAHDGGEFFTPVSLVSLIANIIEPTRGSVLDPACGSGGMFVQSARFVERLHENPTDKLTFYGLEKNATTIRLAKMNLAVHGLEGNIQKAITYYEDPHELFGKADYVMANPPFNVDEIDAEKMKSDPRLPLGLPGISKGSKDSPWKKGKFSNGNYVWISFFYSYLSPHGRAGFVMSSQASSAGGDEMKVRKSLIETGAVEAMVSIRSGFFYTRTVPCELWFLNRAKAPENRDKVLMIDARNIYRKVTRAINDFSPEQAENLLAIVWLYRGQTDRYLNLVASYCSRMLDEAKACFKTQDNGNDQSDAAPVPELISCLDALHKAMRPFLQTLPADGPHAEALAELNAALPLFQADVEKFENSITDQRGAWKNQKLSNGALKEAVDRLAPLAEASRDLLKQTDLIFKLFGKLIDVCEADCSARASSAWVNKDIQRTRKAADAARGHAVEQLKQVRYFWRQAHWLTERFPDAKLRDVAGLVKLVGKTELAENDYSLTPGRYVGVSPEETDEDFDFEETLRQIHVELEDLNGEAVKLAAVIKRNFEELGV